MGKPLAGYGVSPSRGHGWPLAPGGYMHSSFAKLRVAVTGTRFLLARGLD